jgi:chromosomal replication initiation ATPase DnaA
MNLAATSARRTTLTEKVYARAAEIERLEKELKISRQKAAQEALEAMEPGYITTNQIVSSFRRRTVREILKISSAHFGISENIIIGPTKPKEVVLARQIAQYVSYNYCSASLPQVGAVFNRDHTTVLYAVRKIEALIEGGDDEVRRHVETIRIKLCTFDLNEMPYWGA